MTTFHEYKRPLSLNFNKILDLIQFKHFHMSSFSGHKQQLTFDNLLLYKIDKNQDYVVYLLIEINCYLDFSLNEIHRKVKIFT